MLPAEIKGKRIIYTVLNWGLGHAARSIPLIKQLIAQGNDLWIASDGLSSSLLQAELPLHTHCLLPHLSIHYKRTSMAVNMLSQLPHLMNHYRLDLKAVNDLQNEVHADIIISDHRYGTINKDCYNIFLGHQLSILNPDYSLNKIASVSNAKLINRFDEVWVPDTNTRLLSGRLSTNTSIDKPIQYIGPLSRFKAIDDTPNIYDSLAVLSGPEPKRTALEKIISNQMKLADGRFAIVTGIDQELTKDIPNIDYFGIETAQTLQILFNQTSRFIGRAGYSTIMDLAVLGLPCLLVPTEGQTEQMYLSKHVEAGQFQFCTEASLHSPKILYHFIKFNSWSFNSCKGI